MRGFPLAHCEPVMLVTPPNSQYRQPPKFTLDSARRDRNCQAESKRRRIRRPHRGVQAFLLRAARTTDGPIEYIIAYTRKTPGQSANPQETAPGKTHRGEEHARGYGTPWSYRGSRQSLVRKKNGELRFCVDYRKLNDITKKYCFPLPRINDTLDTLVGARWFFTLDLAGRCTSR